MSDAWRRLRERYGQDVILHAPGGDVAVKAFFQPDYGREDGSAHTPLGVAPVGEYLYLGPAEIALEGVETLSCGGRRFRLVKGRDVRLGAVLSHRWALAVEDDGEGSA